MRKNYNGKFCITLYHRIEFTQNAFVSAGLKKAFVVVVYVPVDDIGGYILKVNRHLAYPELHKSILSLSLSLSLSLV